MKNLIGLTNKTLQSAFFEFAEIVGESILIVDQEENILFVNNPCIATFRYQEHDELLHSKFNKLLAEDDPQPGIIDFLKKVDHPTNSSQQCFPSIKCKRRDGSSFKSNITCGKLLDPSGKSNLYLLSIMELSEPASYQEQIRIYEKKAQSITDGIAGLNSETNIDKIYGIACKMITQGTNFQAVIFLSHNKNTKKYSPSVIEGLVPIELLEVVDQLCFQVEQTISTNEIIVLDHDEIIKSFRKEIGCNNIIFSFLEKNDEKLGVIVIPNFEKGNPGFFGDINVLCGTTYLTSIAISNSILKVESQLRLDQTRALHIIETAISSSLDLHVILDIILTQMKNQLKLDAACVLLFDPSFNHLNYYTGIGFRSKALQQSHLRLGEGLAGNAALQRQVVYIPDIRKDRSLFSRSPHFIIENFISYIAIPLVSKRKLKGVIEIYQRDLLNYDNEWINFAQAIADQAAIAIDNISLFIDLEKSNANLIQSYEETIEGWSRALDMRDKETEGHTLRVTGLTIELGKLYGFNDDKLTRIRRGALLHDIGKMGVPDRILLKKGPLTKSERVLMEKHPVFAYELLYPISYLRPAIDIPYCHHERWDGTGYPQNLKGEQIPLFARIFSVIDVYDALISDRPYRTGWNEEDVLRYINQNSGSQFDPDVVYRFNRLMKYQKNNSSQVIISKK